MSIAALVILAPLVSAILALSLRRNPATIAVAGAAVALIAAIVTIIRVTDGERFATTLPGLPDVPLRLVVDPPGALFSVTVAVVSALVLVYAVGYMTGERDQVRFFAGMGLFVGGMQILVLAGDWILLLAAWELIGVASWLLIGFWFERPGIGAAATRAFLVTRAADAGLYVGVFARPSRRPARPRSRQPATSQEFPRRSPAWGCSSRSSESRRRHRCTAG